jgi:acetate kinase
MTVKYRLQQTTSIPRRGIQITAAGAARWMNALVFNPGSNSLKAGIVRCQSGQWTASDGTKLVEVILEGIGKQAKLSVYRGKKIAHSEPVDAPDFEGAATAILSWLDARSTQRANWDLNNIEFVGIRVVHGGARFLEPAMVTAEVEKEILELAKWAPLHNRNSIAILPSIRNRFPSIPVLAAFDTSFHRTIPTTAALYAIPFELSQKHSIRRYGFHGISHRYMLERYAAVVKRDPQELNLITMHLESGCSVAAIQHGISVDTTMGLTPLEGLMMGTRSGDVDPSLLPFLMRAEGIGPEEATRILEKKSGLLGVSGKSLDTRVLMRDYDTDTRVRLAMEMFSYRLLKAVGAYLAALGGADALIFGGGIGENTPLVRRRVCEGLRWCGVEMDSEQNRALIDIEGRLSTEASPIQAFVVTVEETLEIAHECSRVVHARA